MPRIARPLDPSSSPTSSPTSRNAGDERPLVDPSSSPISRSAGDERPLVSTEPTEQPPPGEATVRAPTAEAGTPRRSAGERAAVTRRALQEQNAAQLQARISAKLDRAKQGGISREELKKIRREAGSDAAADAALKRALGEHLPELDETGASWVQEELTPMGGHVAGYQSVLGAYTEGAQLLDANWDGVLDEGDLALKPGAGGAGKVTPLDEKTLDRVKLSSNIVDAAWDMAKAKHAFATLDKQSFNPELWEQDPTGKKGTFRPKSGVTAWQAMNDVFQNPGKYKFECATAMVLTYYRALEKTVGPEAFNAMAKDLRVGPWQMEGDLGGALRFTGNPEQAAPAGFDKKVKPGQYAYFKNWDVSDEARAEGWQGENVLALGDGKFYGHPFGIIETSSQVVEELNRSRKPGSKISAGLLNYTGEVSEGIV